MGNIVSSRSPGLRQQPSARSRPPASPDDLLQQFRNPGTAQPRKRLRGTEDDDLQYEDSCEKGRTLEIGNNYQSVEGVQHDLNEVFSSFNLVVGFDCTESNKKSGRRSFRGRSLHATGPDPNPYELVLTIIGRTLSLFESGEHVPGINCFGFGDETTRDRDVFSLLPYGRPCKGMADVLTQYRALIRHARMAGPTSFAPIINAALDIVARSEGEYHILVIIADGSVSHSAMRVTVNAIVNASYFPLSIVVVGVGDGPWNMIDAFIEKLPARHFDNFHFVNFTRIMQSDLKAPHLRDAEFAAALVKEIPSQCRAIIDKRIMELRVSSPGVRILPPPSEVLDLDRQGHGRLQRPQMPTSNLLASSVHVSHEGLNPRGTRDTSFQAPDEDLCQICCIRRKDTRFNCGHQLCYCCSTAVEFNSSCPFCRAPITTSIAFSEEIRGIHLSLEEVQESLYIEGINVFRLILAIDFAKLTLVGPCLHTIGRDPNLYEQAVAIVGRALVPFPEDNYINSFGFGDRTTQGRVFSLSSDRRLYKHTSDVLTMYRESVPHIVGAGSSSFVPAISAATSVVEESGDEYHTLVIVTENQVEVTLEDKTVEEILKASSCPLSIVVVGVGDGPWNRMGRFVDGLPAPASNSFHFVSFTQIMRSDLPLHIREAQFAAALVEKIGSRYKAVLADLKMGHAW